MDWEVTRVHFPIVRLVSEPRATARVLFDFNVDTDDVVPTETRPEADWSWGSPSLSGPVDTAGRQWGTRVLEFPLRIRGDRHRAEAAVSRLARHVLRPGWLMFQLTEASSPVFFQTFVGEPGSLDMSQVYLDPTRESTWRYDARIPAAAFAVGEEVTHDLGLLSNNPHTGGCTVRLPDIKGDAPAPLTVSLTPQSNYTGNRLLLHLAASSPERAAAPIWWDLADLRQSGQQPDGSEGPGGWEGPVVADPKWPGSGYRTAILGSPQNPTNSWLSVAGKAPTRGTVHAGRYRLFARVGPNTTGGYFDMAPSNLLRTPRSRIGPKAGEFATWVPLADLSWPAGVDLSALAVDDIVTEYAATLHAYAGSGRARLGGFLAVPIDGPGVRSASTLIVDPGGIVDGTVGTRLLINGAAETMLAQTSTGAAQGLAAQVARGSYPVVTPGSINQLSLLLQVAGTGAMDSAAESTNVTVTYRPRHLWVSSTALDEGAS